MVQTRVSAARGLAPEVLGVWAPKQSSKDIGDNRASNITCFSAYILYGWVRLLCNWLLAFCYEFVCVSVLTWNDHRQNKAIILSVKCLTAEPTKRGQKL